MKYVIAPSILSADFTQLGKDIKETEEGGAAYLHFDVMDGMFVPNISFGIPVMKSIRKATHQVMDAHLMVQDPIRYVKAFKEAGADLITVHAEACKHLDRTIHAIKDRGVLAGVALNPATPLSVLDYILPECDMVLLMSVNPGFGGQKYIPYTTQKIRDLKQMMKEKNCQADIEVDGGVSLKNVQEVLDAGANIIVAGTAVFKGDIQENVRGFLDIMEK